MHSVTNLNDQGYKIFKDTIFQPLCDNTTTAITSEIMKQRNEEAMIDIEILRGSVTIYLKLSSGKLA